MRSLKTYVHWRVPSGAVLMSEQMDFDAWCRAIDIAQAHGASHTLLHAGFDRLPDATVYALMDEVAEGLYITQAAASVRPQAWLQDAAEVTSSTRLPIFRAKAGQDPTADPEAGGGLADSHRPGIAAEPKKRGRPRRVAVDAARPPAAASPEPLQFASLGHFLDHLWTYLKPSEVDVLQGRWGYGGEELTLEQLGRRRGLTRARIGQIEATGIGRLATPEVEAMRRRLQGVEAQCALPLPLADLEKLDSWFDGGSTSNAGFRNLVRVLFEGTLDLIDAANVTYVVPFTQQQWNGLVVQAREKMRVRATQEALVSDVEDDLRQLLSSKATKHLALLWRAAAGLDAQITDGKDGPQRLVAFGHGAKEIIRAVLWVSAEPIHRAEIVARVQERAPRDNTETTITNALPFAALLMGRGIYGVRRHIPLNDQEIADLVAVAEEVVLTGPMERQWTNEEICNAIREQALFTNDALSPYVLGACLRYFGTRLSDVKKGVWMASGRDGNDSRVLIRDSIIEFLRDAGHPLNTAELKIELLKKRGINAIFQIQPRDPLIRLGTATWGLLDRDLPITLAATTPYLDALKAQLLRTGGGIHVSEVLGVLANAGLKIGWISDPELMLTLAQRTGAMKVTPSRYVSLSDWPDEKRTLPREAVLKAVQANPRQGAEAIALDASSLAGRGVSALLARSLLNDNGYRFDHKLARWVLNTEAEEDV